MVYQKLIKLQCSLRALAADAKGRTGAAQYGYVSGTKLLTYVRGQMDSLGLLLFQDVEEIINSPMVYKTSNGEKKEVFTTIKLKFTWVDVEDGTSHVSTFAANGMNAFDKGLGSALTYAERYYLMKTFHIPTDEDDVDAIVREEAVSTNQRPQEQTPLASTTEPSPEEHPKYDVPYDVVLSMILSSKTPEEAKSVYETYRYSFGNEEVQELKSQLLSMPIVKQMTKKNESK